MKSTILSVLAILGLAGVGLLAGFAPRPETPMTPAPAPTAAADTFKIDSAHSGVVFKITHLGVSSFWGRFNEVSGSFTLDDENPGASSLVVTVPTASIDSNSEQRDNHLKSPDFFNAKEFKTIEFKSTSVEKVGTDLFKVTGELSLHGVTKPMTVSVKRTGEADCGPRMGYRSGFETEFTIKRTDFGMDTYVKEGMLGDEVTLHVGVEGMR